MLSGRPANGIVRAETKACPDCKGSGKMKVIYGWPIPDPNLYYIDRCMTCLGTGKLETLQGDPQ